MKEEIKKKVSEKIGKFDKKEVIKNDKGIKKKR
jgi:hypothetical protein